MFPSAIITPGVEKSLIVNDLSVMRPGFRTLPSFSSRNIRFGRRSHRRLHCSCTCRACQGTLLQLLGR